MFSLPDVSRILKTPIQKPDASKILTGVSIDTRTLEPGNLFVALQGTSSNGHISILEDSASAHLVGGFLR